MSKKLVVFGPWSGEFCYELSWWIPEARKRKNTEYENFESVHFGYEGREVLYRDFIDHYIPFPKELEDKLVYPSNYAQVLPNRTVGFPEEVMEFVNGYIQSVKDSYNEVVVHHPTDLQYRCHEETPYGEFLHYEPDPLILQNMQSEIEFEESERNIVALMARTRLRNNKICKLDWNPKNWEIFIDLLINDLMLNVCIIDIPQRNSYGGSLSFRDTEVYKRNEKNIKPIAFSGSDSVERQIALLKLTSCSIYGASGTAVFPFFTKTPTFTQQPTDEAFRLRYKWERDLTDNLNNVCIFEKYHSSELWDTSPVEMYCEFKKFYNNLMKVNKQPDIYAM